MRPTRNNRGKSHENGSIESPHGHFKRRLHQALLLRNSYDFDSIESYQQFIEQVVQQLNALSEAKWQEEKLSLQPLPPHKFPDYEVRACSSYLSQQHYCSLCSLYCALSINWTSLNYTSLS